MTMQRVVYKAALHTAQSKSASDLHYWLSQPVQARLAAVEALRLQTSGYLSGQRMERVCRVVALHS